MNYRKLLIKALTLQCTVVKGSLMSFLLLAISPIAGFLWVMCWIEEKTENATGPVAKLLNTPIRLPGIITEADQACSLNIQKYERFLGLRDR